MNNSLSQDTFHCSISLLDLQTVTKLILIQQTHFCWDKMSLLETSQRSGWLPGSCWGGFFLFSAPQFGFSDLSELPSVVFSYSSRLCFHLCNSDFWLWALWLLLPDSSPLWLDATADDKLFNKCKHQLKTKHILIVPHLFLFQPDFHLQYFVLMWKPHTLFWFKAAVVIKYYNVKQETHVGPTGRRRPPSEGHKVSPSKPTTHESNV